MNQNEDNEKLNMTKKECTATAQNSEKLQNCLWDFESLYCQVMYLLITEEMRMKMETLNISKWKERRCGKSMFVIYLLNLLLLLTIPNIFKFGYDFFGILYWRELYLSTDYRNILLNSCSLERQKECIYVQSWVKYSDVKLCGQNCNALNYLFISW